MRSRFHWLRASKVKKTWPRRVLRWSLIGVFALFLASFLPVLAYDGANMTQIDAGGIVPPGTLYLDTTAKIATSLRKRASDMPRQYHRARAAPRRGDDMLWPRPRRHQPAAADRGLPDRLPALGVFFGGDSAVRRGSLRRVRTSAQGPAHDRSGRRSGRCPGTGC